MSSLVTNQRCGALLLDICDVDRWLVDLMYKAHL